MLRFRPIMMTSLAAILGALPIALGTGAGAELRQPLGVAVVGGLMVSQLLTLYITPVVYLAMDHISGLLGARPDEVPDRTDAVLPEPEQHDLRPDSKADEDEPQREVARKKADLLTAAE